MAQEPENTAARLLLAELQQSLKMWAELGENLTCLAAIDGNLPQQKWFKKMRKQVEKHCGPSLADSANPYTMQ